MTKTPLLVAVAGIGGFGRAHNEALRTLEKTGLVKVVAACDPQLERLGDLVRDLELKERGVRMYTDFDEMLATHQDELRLVTIAAPIRFHGTMHRACVERGIACYLEKPPTLDPEELEAMIEADARAREAAQVGFNYIYQPYRLALKERLLSGEFGAVLQVASEACWPRPLRYYGRNNWAGRLLLDDYILLDSCCGNAISHHLQNILFFAGDEGLFSWATPAFVESELYRANAIEGTDTIFARGVFSNGVNFRVANTHATEAMLTREWIVCEKATIEISMHLSKGRGVKITWKDGRVEEQPITAPLLKENFELYCDYLLGKRERPVTLLKDCRGFVQLNALFYLAAERITTLSAPLVEERETVHAGHPTSQRSIPGIVETVATMIATGEFPSEQGLSWGVRGGSASIEELGHLREVLQRLALETATPA
ncbi:MAG TPA: Gfo/Idh/MocA family oxidoreductase [Chthoniobacteraceae bacterium]|nr:Gfo/Idh/MocA family oxidoreductase [Chthoniobacteraceae bacterium]